jgi:hypothetical protein
MKIINTRPDKHLIESIEIDFYDILYKAQVSQSFKVLEEVAKLLTKYVAQKFINYFTINIANFNEIGVNVFTPRKIKIYCRMP